VPDVEFNRVVFLVEQPGLGKDTFAFRLIIARDDCELCHCRVSLRLHSCVMSSAADALRIGRRQRRAFAECRS
jgi:hypothetical protein